MIEMTTYTVTISGSERFAGEKPYTWAVLAATPAEAEARALDIHLSQGLGLDPADPTEDERVLIEEAREILQVEDLHEGLPPEGCGYHWNDVRDLTR
ncbi:hypothetical protein [Nonomuraea salmonea]|uniref:Uncharacterized protein n=1 Tax=Nonomuraea salmonea TaxID=46181 RepID=A0ABV5P313_9ACTN